MPAALAGALSALPLLLLLSAVEPSVGRFLRVTEPNPLLTRLDEAFPPFGAIRSEHVVPAITELIGQSDRELRKLESDVSGEGFVPGADTLLGPFRLVGDKLSRAWGLIQHLKSVSDSAELREAVEAVRPEVVRSSQASAQSQPLYKAFKALHDGARFGALSAPQRRLVELQLQDFRLSGIALEGVAQEEYNNITQRLSLLSDQYSESVLDATQSWKKWVNSKDELEGVPEAPIQLFAEAAAQELNGTSGAPYLLTLDGPTASALLTYAEDADLRKEVYLASIGTASELLSPDNAPTALEILALRQRKAELLGFQNFVELSMQRKMATQQTAESLLEDLRLIAYPKAVEDLEDVRRFAEQNGYEGQLKHWDVGYWGHRQVKELYDIDAEDLRPYFPLERCLNGLFDLTKKMLNVTVEPAEGPTWHEDVRLFKILHNGEEAAHVYMDLFARAKEKRSGAWQIGLVGYDKLRGTKPIAGIVASLRPPVSGKPALLSFGELHTVFHEFGHALQQMLTTQEEPLLAGNDGVEWDAVELPSQFMEYWLEQTDWVVKGIGRHYETNEELPADKFSKFKASLKYHSGMSMLGQLHLSFLDLDLHERPMAAGETLQGREAQIAQTRKTKVLPPLPQDRFLCHFSHIFAGGYAAGYYSYKWADVLSADAFARFEEEGATKDTPEGLRRLGLVGSEYANTILAEGGGRKAEEVFESFRGRPPSTKALLRYSLDA